MVREMALPHTTRVSVLKIWKCTSLTCIFGYTDPTNGGINASEHTSCWPVEPPPPICVMTSSLLIQIQLLLIAWLMSVGNLTGAPQAKEDPKSLGRRLYEEAAEL